MSKKIYYVIVETRHDIPLSIHTEYALARWHADFHNRSKSEVEPLHVVLAVTPCTFIPQEIADYYAAKENGE